MQVKTTCLFHDDNIIITELCSLEQGPLDTHGFYLNEGTSYNSFLIQTEQVTVLIDLAPVYFKDMLLDALKQLTNNNLETIDYLFINHAEADHTGALTAVSNCLSNVQLVCSDKCFNVLSMEYPEMRFKVHRDPIKEPVSLIEGVALTMVPVPMLHWPESCVTVMALPNQRNILFSNDSFGQHICAPSRQMDIEQICQLATVYMVNILYPFKRLLIPVLKQIREKINPIMILPAHGLCYTSPESINRILATYEQLIQQPHGNSATVIYETIYGSCKHAAEHSVQVLNSLGWTVEHFNLKTTESAVIATAIAASSLVVIASPTFYGNLAKVTTGCLTYFNNLRLFDGRNVLLMSSYGWSRVGARRLSVLIGGPFATKEVEWIGAVTDDVKSQIEAALKELIK